MAEEETGTLAMAIFDFEGIRDDNLQFKQGDIITIIKMDDSGWWKGMNSSGKSGIFPYNYVELRDEVGASFPIMRALFDFQAPNEQSISFQKGDLITVVKELSVDWFLGHIKGNSQQQGHFPANYVEKTDMEDNDRSKAEKKRWSNAKKDRKKEADAATKKRESVAKKLQKEEKKKKEDENSQREREMLVREKQQAESRAREAEEELARVRAEAELLKKKQLQSKARSSVRQTSKMNEARMSVRQKANATAIKFQGMAPGPPPREPDKQADIFKVERPAFEEGYVSIEAADEEPLLIQEEASDKRGGKPKGKQYKYNSKFANLGGGSKCAKCNESVGFADKVKALNAEWHTNCFTCSTCSVVLRQGEWRDGKGNPYCKVCHAQGFGPKGFGFGGSLAPTYAAGKADATVDRTTVYHIEKTN